MTVSEDRKGAGFAAVEARLREMLQPLRSKLVATRDQPGDLALEIPGLKGKPWGYVAGIRRGKRYVSYYLMSAYADPKVMASMSPELKRRMQGKSCFNFTHVDEPLFVELGRITETTFEPHVAYAKQVDAERSSRKTR